MPRPKKSDEQIAEMRERILDAALEILNECGIKGVSIRAIAERVGVSHMALYNYFESRDAIVSALSERQGRRWSMNERREAIMQQAETGDICAATRESLMLYADAAQARIPFYRLVWVQPLTTPKEHDKQRCKQRKDIENLTRLIEIGIERGNFTSRDPEFAAMTVLSLINAPLILFHSGRFPDPDLRDRLFDEVLDIAMDYLCKPDP
jgi:AcrR family transcriptional regulator